MKGSDHARGNRRARRSSDSIERFVRSLAGVAGAAVTAAPDGSIESLTITPEPGVTDRQVLKNVVSGVLAGLGIPIRTSRVMVCTGAAVPGVGPRLRVVDGEPALTEDPARSGNGDDAQDNGRARAQRALDVVASVRARERISAPDAGPRVARARPNGRGVGVSARLARAAIPLRRAPAGAEAAEPKLELDSPRLVTVRLDHLRHGRMRCRVVLAVGSERFLAIGHAQDGPGAEVELAARTATDALRAARGPGAPAIHFDGAALAEVRGRLYAIASLRIWTPGGFDTRAGVAVAESHAEVAAARSVVEAVSARK